MVSVSLTHRALWPRTGNDNGGCLGREVQIVEYDDKNTFRREATTIAQKIVSDKDNIAGADRIIRFRRMY